MERVVIVTGANHGIGLETCKAFLAIGKNVIAISRSTDNLEKIKSDKLKILSVDITGRTNSIFEFLDIDNSKVEILINNAGMLINKTFLDTSDEEFKEVFDVNFFSVVRLIRKLMPYFEDSHIVNIGSMGGVQGSSKFPGLSAYSSSKAALMNLTELLAEEFKDLGIIVNSLALGAVQTKMLENAFPAYTANTSSSEMGEYIANFAVVGKKLYNGKILSVSNSTP